MELRQKSQNGAFCSLNGVNGVENRPGNASGRILIYIGSWSARVESLPRQQTPAYANLVGIRGEVRESEEQAPVLRRVADEGQQQSRPFIPVGGLFAIPVGPGLRH